MLIAQSSLSIVHLLLMCARKTAKNDDGVLRDVLRTAERVSSDLSSRTSPREGRMDLSRCTSDELRAALAPMVRELKKIDAAALLSLTHVDADVEGGVQSSIRRGASPCLRYTTSCLPPIATTGR